MSNSEVTIPVQGMTCQKCVAKVTALLQGYPQVEQAAVSLEKATATLQVVSGQALPLENIKAALVAAGFQSASIEVDPAKIKVEDQPVAAAHLQRSSFALKGMSCVNCAASIEKGLRDFNGVHSAQVNFAAAKLSVEHQDLPDFAEQIIGRVSELGYRAEVAKGFGAPTEDTDTRQELLLLLIAAAGSLPIMLLMFVPLFGSATMLVNALLASIVQFTAGLGFYRSAWKSLRNRSANMDVLVSLGISAAYGYSLLALLGVLGSEATMFFETSAMLILFIRFGKWLESRAKGKAGGALRKLLQLQADRALLIDGETQREVLASQIVPGDLLLVRAGEKIPVDGEVVEGTAAVDEAMISGEAVPVNKEPGSQVTGATVNRSGRLVIRATRVGEQTVLAQIVRMVEDAQADKAPIQRLADRVSNYFVPAVVFLSLLTFVCWYLLADSSFLFAFQMSIAVVVIACPCALGLATPTAIMVGSSVGLERGILFKKASALERISKLQVLLLDKTGTVTSGDFKVAELATFSGSSEAQLLTFAAALEDGSSHPLARAVVAEAQQRQLQWQPAQNLEEIGGHGLRGVVGGRQVLCGSQRLLQDAAVELSQAAATIAALVASGRSLVFLAIDGQLQGVIALSDTIKENAARAVAQLQRDGLQTVLLTGDRQAAALAVATQIKIDRVEAEVLPEQKLQVVKRYQQQGLIVGMVGDGINDAPALAQADIGIAIGSGTDVAKETGDLILVGGDLFDVVRGIQLGRQTLRKIKQNLFWAFFYNVLGIPLAAGLFYPWFGLYLKPEFAGLAMAFSSVSVVTNSLLLRRMKQHLQELK
ncbi:MAG TPA: heavy metal translocating P-type ATPase [Malonomonas sp.]